LCFGLVELVEQASDKETTESGSILIIKDVVKDFDRVRAVDHCSFNVGHGTITGLIGPNGAGKTTNFNLITGFLKPSGGSIWFLGRRIDDLPPHRIFQQGILRTFQIPRELKGMTVLENLMLVPGGQLGEKVWASWLMLWHRH
jgi:branched-chain amino acid transport system ATP-binding protein